MSGFQRDVTPNHKRPFFAVNQPHQKIFGSFLPYSRSQLVYMFGLLVLHSLAIHPTLETLHPKLQTEALNEKVECERSKLCLSPTERSKLQAAVSGSASLACIAL